MVLLIHLALPLQVGMMATSSMGMEGLLLPLLLRHRQV